MSTHALHGYRKNIAGTISFTGQFAGMRKPQEFIVYPMPDSSVTITVQTDTRIGRINLDTGEVKLSKPHANGANLAHLVIDRSKVEQLGTEDIETLRGWVRSTGGVEVGSSVLTVDNTGAIAL